MWSDDKMKMLEGRIHYQFNDRAYLIEAVTHKSYTNENLSENTPNNQRLEFLGDAVLDLIMSQFLIEQFPHAAEGELSKIRAFLVNEESLCRMATDWNLGEFIRFGRGEIASGGKNKPSILADTYEAIVAAIYLDSDFYTCKAVMLEHFTPLLDKIIHDTSVWQLNFDHKTQLQEYIQTELRQTPVYYLMAETGPEHDKRFHSEVRVGHTVVGKGAGRSKKESEQMAARNALETINIKEFKQ